MWVAPHLHLLPFWLPHLCPQLCRNPAAATFNKDLGDTKQSLPVVQEEWQQNPQRLRLMKSWGGLPPLSRTSNGRACAGPEIAEFIDSCQSRYHGERNKQDLHDLNSHAQKVKMLSWD